MAKTPDTIRDIISAHGNNGAGLVELTQYGIRLPDETEVWGNPLDQSKVNVPLLVDSESRRNSYTSYYLDPRTSSGWKFERLDSAHRDLRKEIGAPIPEDKPALLRIRRSVMIMTSATVELEDC